MCTNQGVGNDMILRRSVLTLFLKDEILPEIEKMFNLEIILKFVSKDCHNYSTAGNFIHDLASYFTYPQ